MVSYIADLLDRSYDSNPACYKLANHVPDAYMMVTVVWHMAYCVLLQYYVPQWIPIQ